LRGFALIAASCSAEADEVGEALRREALELAGDQGGPFGGVGHGGGARHGAGRDDSGSSGGFDGEHDPRLRASAPDQFEQLPILLASRRLKPFVSNDFRISSIPYEDAAAGSAATPGPSRVETRAVETGQDQGSVVWQHVTVDSRSPPHLSV
jgi:hypothetical protein